MSSVVDKLGWSRAAFWYLLFSQSARSGAYCHINQNAFCLAFQHLFTMDGNDDYFYCLLSLYSFTVPKTSVSCLLIQSLLGLFDDFFDCLYLLFPKCVCTFCTLQI